MECVVLGQEEINPGNLITCRIHLSQTSIAKLSAPAENSPNKEDDQESDDDDEEVAVEFDEDGNMMTGDDRSAPRLKALLKSPLTVVPLAHTPRFPLEKRPTWWVAVCTHSGGDFVVPPQRIVDFVERKRTVTVQFAGPRQAGTVPLAIHVRSDAILGADIEMPCSFRVTPARTPATTSASVGKESVQQEEESDAEISDGVEKAPDDEGSSSSDAE